MSDILYREIILEHWEHPQNYGVLKNSDIDITENNPLCGDEIRLMVKKGKNKIKKISFTGQGCAISIASASLLTIMVKDMKIEEIKKIKTEDFLNKFEFCLSPARIKCALLAFSTLKKALKK